MDTGKTSSSQIRKFAEDQFALIESMYYVSGHLDNPVSRNVIFRKGN